MSSLKSIAWAAAGAALGGVAAATTYGVTGKSSQMFGPSVYRGPGMRRSIALTFDDGPSAGTLDLLDYLDGFDIKATFFECGMNVRRHPEIAREVVARGHQLGNHTWSHPKLCGQTAAFIDREFTDTQHILIEETGVTPIVLRAPYGLRWYGMAAVQRKLQLLGVMWTVIGNDWKLPAGRIAARVLRHASPGGIVCLHDGRDVQPHPDVSEMLEALRRITPVLVDDGYEFETVNDILIADLAN